VIYTQTMIRALIEKGLLTVDPDVLTEAVVVSTTIVDEPVKAYTAPVGAPLPADLTNPDPEIWKTPHQDLAELLGDADNAPSQLPSPAND
jgi:hypothetical protein